MILCLVSVVFGTVLPVIVTSVERHFEAPLQKTQTVKIPCGELSKLCQKNADIGLPEMTVGKYEVCRSFKYGLESD